eukprot:5956153-Amphidinium_carterae.1
MTYVHPIALCNRRPKQTPPHGHTLAHVLGHPLGRDLGVMGGRDSDPNLKTPPPPFQVQSQQ